MEQLFEVAVLTSYSNRNKHKNETKTVHNQTGTNSTPCHSHPNIVGSRYYQASSYSNQASSYSNQASSYSNQASSYSNQASSYSNQASSYSNQASSNSNQASSNSNQASSLFSKSNTHFVHPSSNSVQSNSHSILPSSHSILPSSHSILPSSHSAHPSSHSFQASSHSSQASSQFNQCTPYPVQGSLHTSLELNVPRQVQPPNLFTNRHGEPDTLFNARPSLPGVTNSYIPHTWNVEDARSLSSYSSLDSVSSFCPGSDTWSSCSSLSGASLNELTNVGHRSTGTGPKVTSRQTGFVDIAFDSNKNLFDKVPLFFSESQNTTTSKKENEQSSNPIHGSNLRHEELGESYMDKMLERVAHDLVSLNLQAKESHFQIPQSSSDGGGLYNKSYGVPELWGNSNEVKMQPEDLRRFEGNVCLFRSSSLEFERNNQAMYEGQSCGSSVVDSGQVSRSSSLSSLLATLSNTSEENLADVESCENLDELRKKTLKRKFKRSKSMRAVCAQSYISSATDAQIKTELPFGQNVNSLKTVVKLNNRSSTSGCSDGMTSNSLSSDSSEVSNLNPYSKPFIPKSYLHSGLSSYDPVRLQYSEDENISSGWDSTSTSFFPKSSHNFQLHDSGIGNTSNFTTTFNSTTNIQNNLSVGTFNDTTFLSETPARSYSNQNMSFNLNNHWKNNTVSCEKLARKEELSPYCCNIDHGLEFSPVQDFNLHMLPPEHQTFNTLDNIFAISQRVVKLKVSKPFKMKSSSTRDSTRSKPHLTTRVLDQQKDDLALDHYGTGFTCHIDSDCIVIRTHSEVVGTSLEASNTEVTFHIIPPNGSQGVSIICIGESEGFSSSPHSQSTKFMCKTPTALLPYLHLFKNVPVVRRSSLFYDSCYFTDSSSDTSIIDQDYSEHDPKPILKEHDQNPTLKEQDQKPTPKGHDPKPTLKEQDPKPTLKEQDPKPALKEHDPKHTIHLKTVNEPNQMDSTRKLEPVLPGTSPRDGLQLGRIQEQGRTADGQTRQRIHDHIINLLDSDSQNGMYRNSDYRQEQTINNIGCPNLKSLHESKPDTSQDTGTDDTALNQSRLDSMFGRGKTTVYNGGNNLMLKPESTGSSFENPGLIGSSCQWQNFHKMDLKDLPDVLPLPRRQKSLLVESSPLSIMERKHAESMRSVSRGQLCPYAGQTIFGHYGNYNAFSSFAGDVFNSFAAGNLHPTADTSTEDQLNEGRWEYERLIFAQNHQRQAYNLANKPAVSLKDVVTSSEDMSNVGHSSQTVTETPTPDLDSTMKDGVDNFFSFDNKNKLLEWDIELTYSTDLSEPKLESNIFPSDSSRESSICPHESAQERSIFPSKSVRESSICPHDSAQERNICPSEFAPESSICPSDSVRESSICPSDSAHESNDICPSEHIEDNSICYSEPLRKNTTVCHSESIRHSHVSHGQVQEMNERAVDQTNDSPLLRIHESNRSFLPISKPVDRCSYPKDDIVFPTCDMFSEFSSRTTYLDTWDRDLLNLDEDLKPVSQFDFVEEMIDRLLDDDDKELGSNLLKEVCCPQTNLSSKNTKTDFLESSNNNSRCLIISFPHGGPKMISTGFFSRHYHVGGVLYDTPTCMGSCGAPVIALTDAVTIPYVTHFIHSGTINVNNIFTGAGMTYFDSPSSTFI